MANPFQKADQQNQLLGADASSLSHSSLLEMLVFKLAQGEE